MKRSALPPGCRRRVLGRSKCDLSWNQARPQRQPDLPVSSRRERGLRIPLDRTHVRRPQRHSRMTRMRVAIVGGPGIGKSTLVRQLADLYHNGAYGEGEEGVWDPRVLEDIDAGRNPVGVTAYFATLYDANYRDAAENDRPGKVMFFEGARITLEAHLAEYPEEFHEELRKVLAIGDGWNPDRVI